jgi:CHAT domain-containing protein
LAERLLKRAVAIEERALGADAPRVAVTLNNLAGLYKAESRYDEAEPLYGRALAIKEAAFGRDHPSVATALNNLATLYLVTERPAEAEPLYRRSITIKEGALGPDHPALAPALGNLAELYRVRRDFQAAAPLYERALAIEQTAYGPDHPSVAITRNNLAGLSYARGRHAEALAQARQATSILAARAAAMGRQRSTGARSEQQSLKYAYLNHLRIIEGAASAGEEEPASAVAEAFEVAQLASTTGAATAIARMAARFAAGDDELARLVRARQDALDRWRVLDERLVTAAGEAAEARNVSYERAVRDELAALGARMGELDDRLAEAFPRYAELANPRPLPLADIQALLAADEALVVYAVGALDSFILAVRRDGATLHRVETTAEELLDAVAELRAGVDLTGILSSEDLPPFDTTAASDLYRRLFAPAEPVLDGVRHVFVVPDEGLRSLPLGVMVTAGGVAQPERLADYAAVPWLARRYAMTVLPSVSSLRALRLFAKRTLARKPFAGFGDPLLEGGRGSERGPAPGSLFRGAAVADVAEVRRLARLPDTARELETIAGYLGGGDVHLREEATEGRLKNMDLTDYRVVFFATHGLVAGELQGLPEAALVLTPPTRGSARDDGLLTASEIARLELDADLVVLSACNTAAGGKPGAGGLSGLAKAFFYAGSRALLVSHWPVASASTVKLTTATLAELAADPQIGRAEALRRAMLALMDEPDRPEFAHPAFWAPFVVVGEGGARARAARP